MELRIEKYDIWRTRNSPSKTLSVEGYLSGQKKHMSVQSCYIKQFIKEVNDKLNTDANKVENLLDQNIYVNIASYNIDGKALYIPENLTLGEVLNKKKEESMQNFAIAVLPTLVLVIVRLIIKHRII